MDYTGFSFAEKKSLKGGEPKYEKTLKQIQDKLGSVNTSFWALTCDLRVGTEVKTENNLLRM